MIVTAALEVLEANGIEGLSMRVLARHLDAKASSLYYHFASKEALLEAMAERIMADVTLGMDRSASRDSILHDLATRFRSAMLQHRDGGRLFAGTFVIGPNVFDLSEVAMAAMLKSGMTERDSVHATFNLFFLVIGAAIEDQAQQTQFTNNDISGIRDRFAALAVQQYPAVLRCIDAILQDDPNERFNRGLDFYISGLPEPSDQTGA